MSNKVFVYQDVNPYSESVGQFKTERVETECGSICPTKQLFEVLIGSMQVPTYGDYYRRFSMEWMADAPKEDYMDELIGRETFETQIEMRLSEPGTRTEWHNWDVTIPMHHIDMYLTIYADNYEEAYNLSRQYMESHMAAYMFSGREFGVIAQLRSK